MSVKILKYFVMYIQRSKSTVILTKNLLSHCWELAIEQALILLVHVTVATLWFLAETQHCIKGRLNCFTILQFIAFDIFLDIFLTLFIHGQFSCMTLTCTEMRCMEVFDGDKVQKPFFSPMKLSVDAMLTLLFATCTGSDAMSSLSYTVIEQNITYWLTSILHFVCLQRTLWLLGLIRHSLKWLVHNRNNAVLGK